MSDLFLCIGSAKTAYMTTLRTSRIFVLVVSRRSANAGACIVAADGGTTKYAIANELPCFLFSSTVPAEGVLLTSSLGRSTSLVSCYGTGTCLLSLPTFYADTIEIWSTFAFSSTSYQYEADGSSLV